MCVPCAVTGDFAEDDAAADRAARRDRLLRRLGLKGTPTDDPEPSQSDLGVSVSLAEGSEVEGGLAERSTMSFALSVDTSGALLERAVIAGGWRGGGGMDIWMAT